MRELIQTITQLRKEGKFKEANIIAEKIKTIYNINLETDILNEEIIQFYFEMSIILFYIGQKDNALKISEKLLATRGYNIPYKLISKNRKFSLSILPCNDLKIQIEKPGDYNLCNPSILIYEDYYYINFRCVNYSTKDGKMKNPTNGKIFITRNFLAKFDKDFNLIFNKEIIDESTIHISKTNPQGLEDIQLFIYQDKIAFVCSCNTTCEKGCDMCFGFLEIKNDFVCACNEKNCEILEINDCVTVKNLKILSYKNKQYYEKNWLPFLWNNELNYIYSQEPFTILDENRYVKIQHNNSINCSEYRNSSGPLEYGDGYLFIIHEMILLEGKYKRMYCHKFLYYDKNFILQKYSLPFKFFNVCIDYCRSMIYSMDKNFLIFGVGLEDCESKILTYNVNEIEKLLFNIL